MKKYPKVRNKINDMLDRYNRLPDKYHSKREYDTSIQNTILTELINLLGATRADLDLEL